jgi:hypothetical protein
LTSAALGDFCGFLTPDLPPPFSHPSRLQVLAVSVPPFLPAVVFWRQWLPPKQISLG